MSGLCIIRGKSMKKIILIILTFFVINQTAPILCTGDIRHDEVLKNTIDLGREVSNPSNICLTTTTTESIRDMLRNHCPHKSFKEFTLYVTIILPVCLLITLILVNYKKYRINGDKSQLLDLITQSTDKQQLETVERLVTQYSEEITTDQNKDVSETAIKACTDTLKEIKMALEHRIAQLDNNANAPITVTIAVNG